MHSCNESYGRHLANVQEQPSVQRLSLENGQPDVSPSATREPAVEIVSEPHRRTKASLHPNSI